MLAAESDGVGEDIRRRMGKKKPGNDGRHGLLSAPFLDRRERLDRACALAAVDILTVSQKSDGEQRPPDKDLAALKEDRPLRAGREPDSPLSGKCRIPSGVAEPPRRKIRPKQLDWAPTRPRAAEPAGCADRCRTWAPSPSAAAVADRP